ncbi:MAG: UGSC family (seleno)protein [Candidatus Rokuibacteriota bacterium]
MSHRTTLWHPADFHAVVWPRGRRMVERLALAKRSATLKGKTIGLLWDSVFHGDEIFPVLQAELTRRFSGVRFVTWDAFGSIFGGAEPRTIAELPDRLRQFRVDAVVSAVGC